MASEFIGTLILLIWNIEKTHYRVLHRNDVALKFQPEKGTRILMEGLTELTIHGIRWDLEGNFEADILLVEHHIPYSFLSVDYLTEEAERDGWKTRGKDRLALTENQSKEFKRYCFPVDDNEIAELEIEKEQQERYQEIVLNVLSEIRNSLNEMSRKILIGLFIGFVLGVFISSMFSWIFL